MISAFTVDLGFVFISLLTYRLARQVETVRRPGYFLQLTNKSLFPALVWCWQPPLSLAWQRFVRYISAGHDSYSTAYICQQLEAGIMAIVLCTLQDLRATTSKPAVVRMTVLITSCALMLSKYVTVPAI